MVDPVEQCSACRQKLWSVVAYCPFCGVQAAAAADDAVKPAQAEAAVVPPPLPKAVPTPAAPTPAAPEAMSKEAIQAALRKAAAEVAESKKPPKPKQPRPAPEVPPVPPQPREQDQPAVPAPRPPTIAGKKWLLGASAACVLVYFFWSPTPSGPDDCDLSLAQARSAMQQENAQEARRHSRAAIDSCKDKQRALRAKTTDSGAQALLKTQLQAQAQAEQQSRQLAQQQAQQESQQRIACEGSNRLTTDLMRTARLESARQNLQRAGEACHHRGETQGLLLQIEDKQAIANKATADASAQLADGALGLARASIDLLNRTNRESTELPELRAALNKAQAASAEAAARPVPAAAPAPQTELLRSFIRDAEASMQQRLYDKAKTYAESAQRIDPRNPEVARLLRRIKEHEMSYLRDRIVIE
ncbi:hypothetical protein N0K08_14505 [Acidovorax sp. Be4]|uniref:Uncharacterized protein n=1 Tax=Acidovorax bellezanensis TaxID=2976702 RepID=A0ABT2PRV6_9BURK|nr:hypothetical protein [Acidovorax sp. Be4]MCT9811853.1 hypothetical protein [Acidovorax sp. Be4]